MKKSTLLVSALALALLQACGGGSSSSSGDGASPDPSPPQPPSPTTGTDEGSVSALFVPASNRVHTMLLSSLGYSGNSSIGDFKQAPDGAMFRTNMLGTIVTKNMAGDANYALGRWAGGSYLTSIFVEPGPWLQQCYADEDLCDLASTVVDYPYTDVTYRCKEDIGTGKDYCTYTNRFRELGDDFSIPYAVYNAPASFPASGAYTCAMQSSTTPIRLQSDSGGAGGSSDGAVKLSFDKAGAHLTGAMTITVDGETGTINVSKLLARPSDTGFAPSAPPAAPEFLIDGTGVVTGVADAGNGGYALVVPYAVKLPSGALYASIARLSCAAD